MADQNPNDNGDEKRLKEMIEQVENLRRQVEDLTRENTMLNEDNITLRGSKWQLTEEKKDLEKKLEKSVEREKAIFEFYSKLFSRLEKNPQ